MYDLIYDVIDYCAPSIDIGEISVHDKCVILNLKKRENMEIKGNVLPDFPSKRWYRSKTHGLPENNWFRREHWHDLPNVTHIAALRLTQNNWLHKLVKIK